MAVVTGATVIAVRAARFGGDPFFRLLDCFTLVLDFSGNRRWPDGSVGQHQHGKKDGNPAAHEKILPEFQIATIGTSQFRPRLPDHLVRSA